jgi:hypothetical protein
MTPEQEQKLQGFAAFLRANFLPGRETDRIAWHMLSSDLNDLWNYLYRNPAALSGPHPIERAP